MQTPSIGRIVHYQSFGTPGGEYLPEPRAAIITGVHPSDAALVADLTIFNPEGFHQPRRVPYADTPTPGHWNWPPRN